MSNFYDEWLKYWDDEEEERDRARNHIHEEELQWVRTKQDYRAAILCSRQNGFITAGTIMLGEIPEGWNTGKHYHGEEGMFIIEGDGFSVIDDKRYDWDTGSCLLIPFGATHQHFNTGKKTVRYYSAMMLASERFAGLAKVVQLEEAAETPMGVIDTFEKADSEVHPEYGRIILRMKDAQVLKPGDKESEKKLAERTDEYTMTEAKQMREKVHHARIVRLMNAPEHGFKPREVEITSIMCDHPGVHSEKHAHMEAVVYVLQGEGFSVVGGKRIDFKKGTLMQVPGPQTVHQLGNNTGKVETQLLRVHWGLRTYFQPIAQRTFPYLFHEYSAYK